MTSKTLFKTAVLASLALPLAACVAVGGSTEEPQKTETTTTTETRVLLPSAYVKREVVVPAKPVPKPVKLVTLDASDNFATGSANLSAKGKSQLDKFLLEVALAEVKKIEIIGHTDSVGSAESNQLLSKRRADAVKQYLMQRGVPVSLITTKGLGETSPISSNDTPEGRAANRRVEIVFDVES